MTGDRLQHLGAQRHSLVLEISGGFAGRLPQLPSQGRDLLITDVKPPELVQ